MTNSLAIVSTTAPITWTNKAGKSLEAHSATAQAFAPKAARITAAQAATLAQLENGQYRPFLRDVAATLTKSDIRALEKFGFELSPSGKAGMVKLLTAIDGLWADSKGKKAALHGVLSAWLHTGADTAPATGADTAPATGADTAPATPDANPLPTIEGLDTLAPDTAVTPDAVQPLPTIEPAMM
jgi:hypothetical protein